MVLSYPLFTSSNEHLVGFQWSAMASQGSVRSGALPAALSIKQEPPSDSGTGHPQAADSAQTLLYEPVFAFGNEQANSAAQASINQELCTPDQTAKPLGFTAKSPNDGASYQLPSAPGAPGPCTQTPQSATPTSRLASGTANSAQGVRRKLSATKLPF